MRRAAIVGGLLLLVACVTASQLVPGRETPPPVAAQIGTLNVPFTVLADGTVMLDRDPVTGLRLSATVRRQLSNLFLRSERVYREDGACIDRFAIDSSVTPAAVDIYRVTLATYDSSDSLYIWSRTGRICEEWQPSVHTHVWRAQIVDGPSPPDAATAARLPAPFHVVLYRAGADNLMGVAIYWRAAHAPPVTPNAPRLP